MFDWVHNNKRVIQVILGLIIVPFAFWGLDSYQRLFSAGSDVASVAGQKITEQEFSEALRQQQERMRGMLGRNYNAAALDSPEIRSEMLEGMISQRLVTQHAFRNNITVGDAQLRDVITSIPAFQEDGKFSKARYEAMLRAEGYSPPFFESTLRRDLMMQQLSAALADSGLSSKSAARQIAVARAQQREIAEFKIAAEPMLSQVKVSAEAVQAYYDSNRIQFQIPEQLRVEYVVLNNDALVALEQPGADEVKAYYAANAAKFGEPEQRQASHILVAFKARSSDAEKAKAREKG